MYIGQMNFLLEHYPNNKVVQREIKECINDYISELFSLLQRADYFYANYNPENKDDPMCGHDKSGPVYFLRDTNWMEGMSETRFGQLKQFLDGDTYDLIYSLYSTRKDIYSIVSKHEDYFHGN